MKKLTLIVTASLVIGISMIRCNEASKKDMTEANKNLKEADQDMKEAVIAANDTLKTQAIANWNSFKNESDSAIASMVKDITKLEEKVTKADNKAKAKLKIDLEKTKKQLQDLKEKLKQGNAEFENDINKFDATVELKNQSFQREFRHDMNELGTAFKDLFRNNVK